MLGRGLKWAGAVAAAAVLCSCASVQLETRSARVEPVKLSRLQGKTLGIIPFEVSYGASRFSIDLRDVKVSVQGQEIVLQGRFLAEDEDMTLGKLGVLDVDILTKCKADKGAVQRTVMEELQAGLRGEWDYYLGFFKGFGEGNMGELSSRPLAYDRTSYPVKVTYLETGSRETPFQEVKLLPEGATEATAGTDLVLRGTISMSTEVVQILEGPQDRPVTLGPEDHIPQTGDYYLTIKGGLDFELVDAATGEVLMTEKEAREYPVNDILSTDIQIPVGTGDKEAYRKYFRTLDLTPLAVGAVKGQAERFLPLFLPYYVNASYRVKAEEG